MSRLVYRLLILLPLLAGCTGTPEPPAGPPASAVRVAIPAYVSGVRRAVRAKDRGEAFRLLRIAEPLDVRDPERIWLLVRLAPSWCAAHDLRRRVRSLPPGDVGAAMRALAAEDRAGAAARVLADSATGPRDWRHLVAAHLLAETGDGDEAVYYADQALRSPRDLVRQEAWLLRGRTRLGDGDLDAAHRAADEAAVLDPTDARPPRLHADAFKAAGRIDDAALQLLAALTIAPESPRYAHRLAETLRLGVEPDTWARVDAALPALRDPAGRNAELMALRALAADHAGRAIEAERHYRAALAGGAIAVPLDRDLRRLLVARGAWREAMAWLHRAVPPDLLSDPHNLLVPRWTRLARASAAAPGPAAPAPARFELGQALVGVGALDEAVIVLDTVPAPEARALATRVRGHLALEAGLRAWIEAGYNAGKRKEEPPTFDAGLDLLRTLARRHLTPDEQRAFADPRVGLRELPLLGSWLDHSTHTTSPVVAHFRRYGRFLMFGQQGDVPVEAIVLSLAALSADRPITSVGKQYRHDLAIGYDRALRSNIAAQGGMLGGACLADGIWIDADSARRTEFELRQALLGDHGFLRQVDRSGPLPADTLDGAEALTDPDCVAARLVARYARRKPNDPWGSYGTLVVHEYGHLVDLDRHLPILPKLPNTAALLVRGGLDFDVIQIELEMRAQLGACVDAPDPDLALAEMLLALPVVQRRPDVHDGGYREGLGAMIRHILQRPDLYPQIDRRKRVLTQLDRLTNAQIRQAARAVLVR
ncbi:MAG: hypothetical protein QNJ90_00160 [Planctomycetota bacterium]|nr:hypothetical protein [Planctomycetota bacterium]